MRSFCESSRNAFHLVLAGYRLKILFFFGELGFEALHHPPPPAFFLLWVFFQDRVSRTYLSRLDLKPLSY
jgi:hypothetical protein